MKTLGSKRIFHALKGTLNWSVLEILFACFLWGLIGLFVYYLKQPVGFFASSVTIAFVRLFLSSLFSALLLIFIIMIVRRKSWKEILRQFRNDLQAQSKIRISNLSLISLLGVIGFTISIPSYFLSFEIAGVVFTNIFGLALYSLIVNSIDILRKEEKFTLLKIGYLGLLLFNIILITYAKDPSFQFPPYISASIIVLLVFSITWSFFVLGTKMIAVPKIHDPIIDIGFNLLKITISMFVGSSILAIFMITLALFAPNPTMEGVFSSDLYGILHLIAVDFSSDLYRILANFYPFIIQNWLSLVALSGISTCLAYLLFFHGCAGYDRFASDRRLRVSSSTWTSILQFMEPLTGAFLVGFIILHEAYSPVFLWISAILFVAVMGLRTKEVWKEQKEQTLQEKYRMLLFLSRNLPHYKNLEVKEIQDVSDIFSSTKCRILKRVLDKKGKVFLLRIRKGRGLLKYDPDVTYLSTALLRYLKQRGVEGFMTTDEDLSVFRISKQEQQNLPLDLEHDVGLIFGVEKSIDIRLFDEMKRQLEKLLDEETLIVLSGVLATQGRMKLQEVKELKSNRLMEKILLMSGVITERQSFEAILLQNSFVKLFTPSSMLFTPSSMLFLDLLRSYFQRRSIRIITYDEIAMNPRVNIGDIKRLAQSIGLHEGNLLLFMIPKSEVHKQFLFSILRKIEKREIPDLHTFF